MNPSRRLRAACLMALVLLVAAPWQLRARPAEEIVNGHPVPSGRYPFMVSLQSPGPKADNSYTSHFCGGALIDETHVLTAAHCVWTGTKAMPPMKLRILAGATRLRERTNREGELLTVRRIAVHPKYDQSDAYDVAVITLKRPAPVSGFISLPAAGDPRVTRPGTIATVSGWGSTRRAGGSAGYRPSYPRELRETSIPLIPDGQCAAEYRKAGIRNLNLRASVCAGGQHRDSCWGDSGGPLFIGGGAAPVQIGIVSWGIGCGRMDYPGIYTRLTNPDIAAFIRKEQTR